MDPKKVNLMFWGSDWDGHPASSIHIAKGILQLGYKVYWVNSIGMRSPKIQLKDIKRITDKLKSFFSKRADEAPPPHPQEVLPTSQLNPFILPFHGSKFFRIINRKILKKQVHEFLRDVDQPIILITTLPNTGDFIDFCDPIKKVYYVMDDFSTFPGVDNRVMLQLEKVLLKRVHGVLFASENVQKKYLNKEANPLPNQLLTHGVDVDHFRTTFQSSLSRPKNLPEMNGPVIGFIGLIDERIDLTLIKKVAQAFPDTTLILIGNNTISLNILESIKNILLVGPVPYQKLPEYLKIFDICIMPYVIGEATNDINPLKLKEYLAAGKKVVTMKIPAVSGIDELVFTADNHEDFIHGINKALERKHSPNEISTLVSNESWMEKSKQMLTFIENL